MNRNIAAPSKSNLSRFSDTLWLTIGMFVILTAVFFLYVRAEKKIDRANELRQQSFMLAQDVNGAEKDTKWRSKKEPVGWLKGAHGSPFFCCLVL